MSKVRGDWENVGCRLDGCQVQLQQSDDKVRSDYKQHEWMDQFCFISTVLVGLKCVKVGRMLTWDSMGSIIKCHLLLLLTMSIGL